MIQRKQNIERFQKVIVVLPTFCVFVLVKRCCPSQIQYEISFIFDRNYVFPVRKWI